MIGNESRKRVNESDQYSSSGGPEAPESIEPQRLAGRGIKPVKSLDLPWKRSFFLRDPDGLLTEYYAPRAGARDLSSSTTELAFLI